MNYGPFFRKRDERLVSIIIRLPTFTTEAVFHHVNATTRRSERKAINLVRIGTICR